MDEPGGLGNEGAEHCDGERSAELALVLNPPLAVPASVSGTPFNNTEVIGGMIS